MQRDLSDRREQYRNEGLDRDDLDPDPFVVFDQWFGEWVATEPYDATAVALATAGDDGRPSVRFVLLKQYGPEGFAFYTNQLSRKGRELAANPHASLVFPWFPLDRQVRVVGRVERVDAAEADDYFATRPRASQESAWASQQSRPIADRAALESALREAGRRFEGAPVPRPPHWGGYLVVPTEIEFWQGRPDRLHDRFAYVRSGDDMPWSLERLQP